MPPQPDAAAAHLETSAPRRIALLVLVSCGLAVVTWLWVTFSGPDTSARDALERRLALSGAAEVFLHLPARWHARAGLSAHKPALHGRGGHRYGRDDRA